MKMCFLFSGTFWGAFLVLLGISVIAKAVFNLNVPFFRLFFGFLFLYVGIRLLMGSFCPFKSGGHAVFSRGVVHTVEAGSDKQHNTVFGEGTLDLRNIRIEGKTATVDANCVFGALEILIPKGVPLAVHANAAFADLNLPGGRSANFGESTYESPGLDRAKPHLGIRLNAVFSRVSFSEG